MSAGKIRAGQAFVEVTLQNRLEAGLRRASAQLRAFANTTAVVGGALVAAGAAVTAPLLAALPAWAETGDQMLKMATRTGVGVKALSELKYAALMADLEMGALEGGLRKLAVKLADATQGNHTAQKAFRDLGIDWQRLRQQSPDKQLETVADALVAIRSPTERAAAAVDMFGKSGTELLPFLAEGGAGLRKMREEADRLGLTMSEESARKAGVLADAFKLLHRVSRSLLPAMAAALAPDMTRWTQLSIGVVLGIRRWIKEHQSLIATVFRVGSVLGVVGTVLLGLAGAMRIAGVMTQTLGSLCAGSFNLVRGLARGLIAPFALATSAIMSTGRSLASLGNRGAAALGGLGRLASGAVASIATALGNLALTGVRAMGALAVQATRLGVAMWTGARAGAARIAALWPQVSAQIAAGLQSVPRVAQAVFATARQYVDSFARGLTGELGLQTTRAAYIFWQLGDAVRGGVARAGQYFQALAPLVRGTAQAAARPFAPLMASLLTRLSAFRDRAARLVPAITTEVRPRLSAAWMTLRDRATRLVAAIGVDVLPRLSAIWTTLRERTARFLPTVTTEVVPRLAAAWNAIRERAARWVPDVVSEILPRVSAVWTTVRERVLRLIPTIVTEVRPRLSAAWTTLRDRVTRLVPVIGVDVLPRLSAAWTALRERAARFLPALTTQVAPLLSAAWATMGDRTTRLVPPVVSEVLPRLSTAWAAVRERASRLIPTVVTEVQPRLSAAWATIFTRLGQMFTPLFNATAAVQAKMQSAWSAIAATADGAVARVAAAWQNLPPWVTGPLAQVASMARQDFGRLGSAAIGAFGVVKSAALSALAALRIATSSGLSAAWSVVRTAGVGAFRAIRVAGMGTVGMLGAAVRRLGAGFATLPGRLRNAGGGMVNALSSVGSLMGGAGVGALLSGLPVVLSLVGSIGAVVASVLSPIGLVVAAIAGGIYAWTQWSDTGKRVLATVTQALRPILDTAKRVFGGISQAMAGGDIKLAAQILWSGLKVIFYQGLDALNTIWPTVAQAADQSWTGIKDTAGSLMSWLAGLWAQLPTWVTGPLGMLGQTLGSIFGAVFSWLGEQFGQLKAWASETFGGIANAVAGGDWGLAFEIAWASIKVAWAKGINWIITTWSEATTGIAMLFDQAVTSIRQAWNAVITWIAQKLVQLWGVAQKTLTAMAKLDPTGFTAKLARGMKIDVQAVMADLEQDKQRKNRGLEQARQQRDDQRGQALVAQQNAAEAELAQLREKRGEQLAQAQAVANAAGPGDRAANAAQAMRELDDALQKAQQIQPAFEIPNFDPGKFRDDQNQQVDDLRGKFSTTGTFNAAALWGFGGSDPTARIAAATEETARGIRVLVQRGGRFIFKGPATP